MKSILVFFTLFAWQNAMATTPPNEVDAITKVVTQFVKGADHNDVKMQGAVMDDNFRVLWNDTNEGAIKVLDKATYLGLIESKKFGGGNRQIEFLSVDVQGHSTATVKVKLSEEGKPSFFTFYSLVKYQGQWLIAQDLVFMQ